MKSTYYKYMKRTPRHPHESPLLIEIMLSVNYKLTLVIAVFEIYNPHISTLTLLGPALPS